MRHLPCFLLAAAFCLTSCGEPPPEPPPVPVDPHEALYSQLKAAGNSPTPPPTLTVAESTDRWIIATPKALDSKWASLALKVPQVDKDRLLKEASASPHVVVARVTEGRIAEVSTLPDGFTPSPEAFTIGGGESLSLARDKPGDPVVVRKSNP
jgi:hypothetical protein